MMKESMIQVICGPGRGKTTSAIGRGLTALTKGKCVYMVQFLKGALDVDNMEIIQRLEPEFKIFRFEKTDGRGEGRGKNLYPERPEFCQEGSGDRGV